MYLADLTWTEAKALAERGAFILLPVGSTEAHGPHLPLNTDVIIANEIAHRVQKVLRTRSQASVIAPPIVYSVTEYARSFSGTVSIASATSSALLRDVTRSLLNQGFARVVWINGHLEPAHVAVLRTLATELEITFPKAVSFPDNTRRQWAKTLSEEFQSGDCHAGEYETSLVLAVRPDLVKLTRSAALPPAPLGLMAKMAAGIDDFRAMGANDGYFGDPASASAEHGEEQYARLVDMVLSELKRSAA